MSDRVDETEQLFWAVVFGAGVYFLYQTFKSVAPGISAATNSIASGVANAYVNATTPTVGTQANMVLSDGSTIPLSSATTQWQGNTLLATVNGSTYALSSANSDGDYPAVQVQ